MEGRGEVMQTGSTYMLSFHTCAQQARKLQHHSGVPGQHEEGSGTLLLQLSALVDSAYPNRKATFPPG